MAPGITITITLHDGLRLLPLRTDVSNYGQTVKQDKHVSQNFIKLPVQTYNVNDEQNIKTLNKHKAYERYVPAKLYD